MEKLLIKQIRENFKEEEINFLMNNFDLIKKIYLLGLINGREIYR